MTHWTSMIRRGSPSAVMSSRKATSATLEASVTRWNIDSPANNPPIAMP